MNEERSQPKKENNMEIKLEGEEVVETPETPDEEAGADEEVPVVEPELAI